MARTLKDIGLSYVGISLDGMQEVNDRFRAVPGAFRLALGGIRNCQAAGIKVGLRFTINRFNVQEIPHIFDLIEEMDIPRVCFYHLVYAGRGSELVKEDLSLEDSRKTLDLIIDNTRRLHEIGKPKEVLTVDNHADGPYIYLRMLEGEPGTGRSGDGTAEVERGQQLRTRNRLRELGRGGARRPVLAALQFRQRERTALLRDLDGHLQPAHGKAQGEEKACHGPLRRVPLLDICGGNFRVRAEAVSGDVWAPDPACYLTDEEIALTHSPVNCEQV